MSAMSEHLSEIEIESLVDRELDDEQSAHAEEHLAACHECSTRALAVTQLKQAIREGAVRYQPSPAFQRRMMQTPERARQVEGRETSERTADRIKDRARRAWWLPSMLPLAASLLIVIALGAALVVGISGGILGGITAGTHRDSLAAEALDQHIAMLAGGAAPEVLSTDKHTVKPWFQGKLPFAFNLPDALPAETTLEGANVTYVQGEPAAELIFHIRKHRASVFVTAKRTSLWRTNAVFARSGFHLVVEETGTLRLIGVSDVDAGALQALIRALAAAQK
jgi:anti-sigma factor RsiW